MYAPTARWLYGRWTMSVWHNAHGLFIPPLVAWMIWQELKAQARPPGQLAARWGFALPRAGARAPGDRHRDAHRAALGGRAGAGAARSVAALPRSRADPADRLPVVSRHVRAADSARPDRDHPPRPAQGRDRRSLHDPAAARHHGVQRRARRSTRCAAHSKSRTPAAASRRSMPRWRSPSSPPTPPRPTPAGRWCCSPRRRSRSPPTCSGWSSWWALVVWKGQPILETFLHPALGHDDLRALPADHLLAGRPARAAAPRA